MMAACVPRPAIALPIHQGLAEDVCKDVLDVALDLIRELGRVEKEAWGKCIHLVRKEKLGHHLEHSSDKISICDKSQKNSRYSREPPG